MMKRSLKYSAMALIVISIGYIIYDYVSDGVLNTEPISMLFIYNRFILIFFYEREEIAEFIE
jgi:hypothetical protein